MILRKSDWHPADIIAALRKKTPLWQQSLEKQV
ncbi:putative DNA-binding protein [Yersinia enterocolitica]|nr:putative DNA-binding protein [Yersinia enterocolitica]